MKRKTIARKVVLLGAMVSLGLTGCDQAEKWISSSHLELSKVSSHGDKHGDKHGGRTEHSESSHEGGEHSEHGHEHKVVVTSAITKDVTTTQTYVCQIHSCKHIEIRALEPGYLEAIPVKEGSMVKVGQSLFRVVPALYQAKLEVELAEAQLAQIDYNNAKRLFEQRVVSDQEVALANAKLAKANAQVKLAQAELSFADVKAPFDGIIDRIHCQQGSLVAEGDVLTTLSDNSLMWVYFNVPEARYLEYKASVRENDPDLQVELVLADHSKFPQPGKIGAIEADFNNETGNIAFRADFPNPDGLLRHGQTGNILIHRVLHQSVVIPQRATFEILAKRYVFVVGEDHVIHQREILVQHEQDDIFVIQSGLSAGEKLVLEGIRQVRDGDSVEFEFRDPEFVMNHLKNKAE